MERMMRPIAVLRLLALGACSRSLELPPAPEPPGPGSISGRVVIALPGRSDRIAAPGAEVSLFGSALATKADVNGQFRIEGITRESGQLLLRYDSDQNGSFD